MRDGIPTWEWRDIGTANRGWLLGHLYEAALEIRRARRYADPDLQGELDRALELVEHVDREVMARAKAPAVAEPVDREAAFRATRCGIPPCAEHGRCVRPESEGGPCPIPEDAGGDGV